MIYDFYPTVKTVNIVFKLNKGLVAYAAKPL